MDARHETEARKYYLEQHGCRSPRGLCGCTVRATTLVLDVWRCMFGDHGGETRQATCSMPAVMPDRFMKNGPDHIHRLLPYECDVSDERV